MFTLRLVGKIANESEQSHAAPRGRLAAKQTRRCRSRGATQETEREGAREKERERKRERGVWGGGEPRGACLQSLWRINIHCVFCE